MWRNGHSSTCGNSPPSPSQWDSTKQTLNSKKSTNHLADFSVQILSRPKCFYGEPSDMTISYNFPQNLISFDIFCPLHTDIKGARTTLLLNLLMRLSILKSIFMLYLCEHNLGILVTVSVL